MRQVFWTALLLGALPLSGCAVVSDHNRNVRKAYDEFKSGNFESASAELAKNRGNKLDGLCFILDSGVVRHVQGEWQKSISDFEAAKRFMGGFDDRAKISVSDIAETGASFLVNEKTIPYKGEGFERVLLPSYQARNYFMKGDIDGAAVEARRCNLQQTLVQKKYEAELAAARSEAQNQRAQAGNVDTSSYFSKVQNEVRIDSSYLNNPQSVYQLAFVDYLTGIMLEAQGDYEGARLFYRKVHLVLPLNRTVQIDMAYAAQRSGDRAGARELAQQFGFELPPPDHGSIVVLFDSGEAPRKEEKYILFPTGLKGSFQKFALPVYKASSNPASGLEVSVNERSYRTEVVTSVEQVAFRYFNDRLPLIVTKAIIRVLAKIAAQKAVEYATRKEDQLVQVLTNIGTSAVFSFTEQADLRAWRTLPQNFQIARIYLPPGRYPIAINLLSSGGRGLGRKELGFGTIRPGKLELLDVRSVGQNFWGGASPGLQLGANPDGPTRSP